MLWDVSLSLNYDDDEISDLTVVLNYLDRNFLLFTLGDCDSVIYTCRWSRGLPLTLSMIYMGGQRMKILNFSLVSGKSGGGLIFNDFLNSRR